VILDCFGGGVLGIIYYQDVVDISRVVAQIREYFSTDIAFSCTLNYRLVRGLLEKYPTFGREKETGLLGALDT
jgi:hypothetical protein